MYLYTPLTSLPIGTVYIYIESGPNECEDIGCDETKMSAWIPWFICVCTETMDGAKIMARKLWRQITVTSLSKLKHGSVYSRTVGVATKITYIYYYTIKRDGAVKYTIFFRCEKCVCEVIISAKTYPHADVKHSFYL